MPRVAKSADELALLNAALEGLELQRQRIEEQIRMVRAKLGRKAGRRAFQVKAGAAKGVRKRELSPAARKRIAMAQKKRWAEYRKKMAAAGQQG